ncbi:hypothetical protein A7Q09_05395 [Methylacidiphilum sp. Yel]|uniref:DUF4276 family protein n=1 Tax=Methylacidiphilum sp. Yel TaxID=1847730 RepID=UPI00106D8AE4|nr:DUF4276 family protein [Methylacidiphilum sp. Yel]TFE69327.1 hypothetical protein A7Q09_05395 [Methylacidiphilum sp. Yel]
MSGIGIVVEGDYDEAIVRALPSDLRNTVQNRMGSLPSVRVVIPVRAIEAWLLAHPKVCRSDYENPEDVLNPKEELKRRLRSKGINYIPKIAEMLAEGLDVEKVLNRCQSFKTFKDTLL